MFFRKIFVGNYKKKLKKYKEDPSDLQLYNFLIYRLDIGLEKIKDDIKNLPEDKVKEKRI